MSARLSIVVLTVILAAASDAPIAAANGQRCRTVAAAATRTSWGDPDLQGIWSAMESSGVPFDRDPTFGTRNVLTDEEFEARQATLRANASPGNNIEATNFGSAAAQVIENRSRQASLVVDPPDGRRPPRTPESDVRQPRPGSFSGGPFNSVADMGIFDRCIAFAPLAAALPFNAVQIVEAPGYVAILSEVIHDMRIVRLDGQSYRPRALKTYAGDSHGRWEGRTLVVTTMSFNGQTNLQGNAGGRPSERLTVIERFTLTDPNTLQYEATFVDPGTWARPWTMAFPRKRDNGAVFEYACHEGNYGLANILSAARAAER